ncbi:S-methyl-5'-thioadenosine phosphorylase [Candidatus Micrarchaeota archaeon]|nr:S-methyl-5'-thioadenosine phosphorylase [Candidatus Micrarchaeota archaeon]
MIGIIGGSGVYNNDMLENAKENDMETPFGRPSAPIITGRMHGKQIAFIPRHGVNHEFPPHNINYRANIWALKQLGVDRLISVCAVGSLKEDYKRGDICIVDQYIDFTKKYRMRSFYDHEDIYHISMADPYCPELRKLAESIIKDLGYQYHPKGTYICIEGPQFSTRAESRMFRNFGDIIGMTACPETQLAREAEMCMLNLAMITDYDAWKEKPVSTDEVLETMKNSLTRINTIIDRLIKNIPVSTAEERSCSCTRALEGAKI